MKLTKAQWAFLKIAKTFGGEARVFPDQWSTTSVLAAKGLIVVKGYIERSATLTPDGWAALQTRDAAGSGKP